MPPRLHEYKSADWVRLRPLTHWLKTRRYRSVDAAYSKLPARTSARLAPLRGRNVLVTVAFTDPQVIDWQVRLVRHYVPHALHIIADNTPVDRNPEAIAAVAEAHGVPYVALPTNPWHQPSRSHGQALNWIWCNLIRPNEPAAFGFLDHDLFPTAPDDPFAALGTQDFYGLMRPMDPRWFLWAGFCFYRFDAVKTKPLDFGQDWFVHLDTGGGNWDVLYRHVDRNAIRFADTSFFPYRPGVEWKDAPLQWCGTWLHEIGVMGKPDLMADKRRVVAEMLAPHLARAGG